MIGFAKHVGELMKEASELISDIYRGTIADLFAPDQLDQEVTQRDELAATILVNRAQLLYASPESKGMLLDLLVGSNAKDFLLPRNHWYLWLAEPTWHEGINRARYGKRCEAIIAILYSLQTQREWQQVMKHMDANELTMAQAKPASEIERNETRLKAFLSQDYVDRSGAYDQQKKSLDEQAFIRYFETFWHTTHARLKSAPAVGYALCPNNSHAYQLCTGANPNYPLHCSIQQDLTTDPLARLNQ